MTWRQILWGLWGVGALVWLAYATLTFGAGLGGERLGGAPAGLSPMLAGQSCDGIADPAARNSCAGVAALARDRRALLQEDEDRHTAMAGTLIVAPILVSLGLVLLIDRGLITLLRPGGRRISGR